MRAGLATRPADGDLLDLKPLRVPLRMGGAEALALERKERLDAR